MSYKLVYPAAWAHRYMKYPAEWDKILGDLNYSLIATRRSGSGKDCTTQHFMNKDLEHGRTIIVLDVKMEYPANIFCQQDVTLRNILLKHNLYGRGYKVNLWIPYVQGMENNEHFKALLKYPHPNLRIRPFRILTKRFISEDSANMAMSKSQLQSMADKSMELKGQSGQLNVLREHMAKMRMAFDDEPLKEEGEDTGWEYIDFDEMCSNREINVISTFFMLGRNSVAAVSFMIGLLNEMMAIGKGVHRKRGKREIFSVIIPEVQIVMPKRVKNLESAVNTLRYSMLVGLLLMRSFAVRLRINLQNLSSLDPDMLSQSRIFVGKTWNPKDLSMLSMFGINRQEKVHMMHLQTGEFVDVMKKQKFSVVPYSHKAREREPFLDNLEAFVEDPVRFLFPTKNAYLSEIIDYKQLGGHWPMSTKEYGWRVRQWLKRQKPKELTPISCEIQDITGLAGACDELEEGLKS